MIVLPFNVSFDLESKVNETLHEICTFFITLCEDSRDFHTHLPYIFPSFLFRNEYDKCINILYELREYSEDGYPHDLEPLYEYALFHLIDWFIDVVDFDETFFIDSSKIKVINEDDKYIASNINNLEEYKIFLFHDHDFLDVEHFVSIFFSNPNALIPFNINLNEYIDLMPYDIRRKYLLKSKNQENNKARNTEDLIIRLIYTAIKQKEHDPIRLNKTSETQLSDDIANILQASLSTQGIITAREQPSGFSSKWVGEVDFFIYSLSNQIYQSIAIGENKEWGNFENHFKQLIGYMNEGVKFGFTIVFNKKTKLSTVLKTREEVIRDFNVELEGKQHFETIELIKGYQEITDILISIHSNPENNSTFKIYHFIANSFRPERRESARQARI